MVKLIENRCQEFKYFSSIKYYVHLIENTKLMQETLLDICRINPYLGALIYVTSENNLILKNKIKKAICEPMNKSVKNGQ